MAAKQPWDNDEEVRGPWEADPDYSGPSVADYADDIIASLVTGINKGAAGAPGLGGDIGYAGDWLLDKMGVTDNKYVRNVLNPGPRLARERRPRRSAHSSCPCQALNWSAALVWPETSVKAFPIW
jgi:hypothetical protein